jgi:hypothetical protein
MSVDTTELKKVNSSQLIHPNKFKHELIDLLEKMEDRLLEIERKIGLK